MVAEALIKIMQIADAEADRRAFYGPDAPPEVERPRRNRSRLARLLRRPLSRA